jgi:octopine/nopaline transport system substrate-binding protein
MRFARWMAVSMAAMVCASPALAKDWKTVTVAMEGSYEPWNLTDPSGKIVGFEVDLLNDLCARMKVECKVIATDWDGVVPGLTAGKFDVIMDGMSITDERQKTIDFSKPYAQSPVAFIAKKDGPLAHLSNSGAVIDLGHDEKAGKAALDKLRAELKGKTIGLQVSTTEAVFADKYLKDIATIREYKTTDEHDLDLMSGRIDAAFADTTYFLGTLAKPDGKDLAFVGPQFKGGAVLGPGIGAGFRKSDKDLTARYDNALKAALADGSVKKYSMEWFKVDITP